MADAKQKKTEAAAAVQANKPAPRERPTTPAKPGMVAAASSAGGAVDNNRADATAKCKDGTYSHAKTHQGACSRHGGVAEWYKQ